MFESVVADWSALAISLALIGIYHSYLRWRVRQDPHFAVHSVNALARTKWVEGIMGSGSKDVLAVQTLRNSVMAASIMASTAALLVLGTLTFSSDIEKFAKAWRALGLIASSHAEIRMINLVLLLADFVIAFYCYSMAIRLFNHVGYMINVPPAAAVGALSQEYVAAYLNRAGRYYSLGMRTFYFAVPLVFWFVGPHLMVLATLGLMGGLYMLDRAPAGP